MNPLSWATTEAFTLLGQHVTWAELFGNAFALSALWLAVARSIWVWPVQLAGNVLLFAVLVNASLGGNAARQVMFAVLSVYGWWRWSRRSRDGAGADRAAGGVQVRYATGRERWLLLAAMLVGTAVMAGVLHVTDSSWSPLPDAYIFVGSAVATYAQGRGLVEFWWIWIAVDLVGVPLAAASGLLVFAAVYAVFFVSCLVGIRDWHRRARAGRPAVALAVGPADAITEGGERR